MSDTTHYDTLEAPARTCTAARKFTIGLPASQDPVERRFPLTPDALQRLTAKGYTVKMEQGAGSRLGYTDQRYMQAGAQIVSRNDALACNIIISMEFPAVRDIAMMHRGAILLTVADNLVAMDTTQGLKLVKQGVMTVAVDLIEGDKGQRPFADPLAEIDGRSSMLLAASLMIHPLGKGILPGGIAGIMPADVVILGSGLAARAAAVSAGGMGARVMMLDHDTYSLREALAVCPALTASVPVPNVLDNALRHADVVIATPSSRPIAIGHEHTRLMKEGVIVIDINRAATASLPSLTAVEASMAQDTFASLKGNRTCYVNPANLVPRAVAMAMGDSLVSLLDLIIDPSLPQGAIQLPESVAKGVLTFNSHCVHPLMARMTRMRCTDINILLQLS